MKALVVGGGIGGLAAAIALRNAGIDVHVYEQAPRLEEIGAGLSLWGNGVKALHLLGLQKPLSDVASPIEEVGSRSKNGRWLNRIPLEPVHHRLGVTSVAMHRGELLQILLRALRANAIHTGRRVTSVEQGRQGQATVVLADGSSIEGDVVIAADGVNSTIRQQLFDNASARYTGYSTWRGVVDDFHMDRSDWPRHAIVRTLGCGEYFGIGDLGGARYLWYFTQNRGAAGADGRGDKEELLEAVASWASPVPEIVAATPDDDVLLHPVYRLRSALRRWHSGRVALLGDAAHPIEPALGMGAALALEDAVELASSLRSQESFEHGFQEYESRRRSRVTRLVRWSRVLAMSEQLSNPLACRLRDLSLRLPSKTATLALARKAMSFSGGSDWRGG